MKLNNFLRFYLLLGCGLFISCQNGQGNVERLDNSPQKASRKLKYPEELDDYSETSRNKRCADINDRSFKILKNVHSDQELPYVNYKSSTGPNNIREMKILKRVDYYLPNKNKNENIISKTGLESELEGKAFKNIKNSKQFDKNHPPNKIKRELPVIFGHRGNTKIIKRISSADKFLNLNEEERERLLEKVLNEINKKLNRPDNGCTDDGKCVKVKPQLLILKHNSKPMRGENSKTDIFIKKAVENPYSSKTYASTPSDSLSDATETVISSNLKTNRGISSIGHQTEINNKNKEQVTTNSKNLSKRENTHYQTDGIDPTTFMPEAIQKKPSMKEPMEVSRVQGNKSEMNNRDETTTDQSEKTVKKINKDGQPQIYQILKNPRDTSKFGKNEGSSESSKMSERTANNNDEDSELMEYIKNNVKNCLRIMKKDVKEDKEKPETEEEFRKDETTYDTEENYSKEMPPQLTEQPSLSDNSNNLNPNEISPPLTKQPSFSDNLNLNPKEISPPTRLIEQPRLSDNSDNFNPNSLGFQLLLNILQSTTSKPNVLLGENRNAHAENVNPHNPSLITEDNYLDEVSSEENGNDPYDVILQTELNNLDEFARTYTKPNMEATRFDRFLGTDLLDELLF